MLIEVLSERMGLNLEGVVKGGRGKRGGDCEKGLGRWLKDIFTNSFVAGDVVVV